ncbi:acetyltransferase, GNAT family [Bacillus sp. JCM 19046]|nr:acetyltransferase, GNAT family [Bacillus sp. JCM 19045]GAF15744.1 acetyltransferase, GNAT family [Bacillus sp. JCM 19046]
MLIIKPIEPNVQGDVTHFFQTRWGSTQMVISSGVYDCASMDGFIALNEKNEIIGLLTYMEREESVEIISLDSIVEGRGVGKALLQAIEQHALRKQINKIQLVTTNDNLYALAFYQKRGYRLRRILIDAVKQARVQKPSIPLVGYDKIPIHDEIELGKQLMEQS